MASKVNLDSATCLEAANSTDCLLRLVLAALEKQTTNAAEEFNWDPLTFFFTAPIGLFAALFAAITIYQAVLSSGPGRRKSNRRAIGPWALKTKTEWSWRDLNSLSIASTPILRADDFLQTMGGRKEWYIFGESREFQDKVLSRPNGSYGMLCLRRMEQVGEEANKSFGTEQPGKCSATWLRFLSHVKLHRIAFGTALVETTMADYLPADLVAVPAYAEIGFLIATAAAGGAHSLIFTGSESSHYPIIIGDGFQFDFRQHPVLGTVGVFSQYGQLSRLPSKDHDGKKDDSFASRHIRHDYRQSIKVLLALLHARGEVYCWPQWERRSRGCELLNTIALRKWLPVNISHAARDISWQETCYRFGDAYRELQWLLGADIELNGIPSIFPGKLSRQTPNLLSILALHHSHWSRLEITSSSTSKDPISALITFPEEVTVNTWSPEPSKLRISLVVDKSGLPADVSTKMTAAFSRFIDGEEIDLFRWGQQFGFHYTEIQALNHISNFRTEKRSEEAEGDRRVVHVVVQTLLLDVCQDLLSGFDKFQARFDAMSALERQYLRALIYLQIQMLDYWLFSVCGEYLPKARTLRLLVITALLLDVEKQGQYDGGEAGVIIGPYDYRAWHHDIVDSAPHPSPIAKHLCTLVNIDNFLRAPDEFKSGNLFQGIHRIIQNIYPSGLDNSVVTALKNFLDKCHRSNQAINGRVPGAHSDCVDATAAQNSQAPRHDGPGAETDGEGLNYKPTDRDIHFGENETRTFNEVLDDLLVWRALLVAALFWSAPDNSQVLKSGIWEQVIPVL
ncbi:hypothetical protein QBC41DRAFT_266937 [Cercophora samala]|uniref:Uncharacterized protein n=1 Tax=Cercophora samala TaxID=330535 RepID=A0AA39ZLB1_9PEZI|nr:hypothetical protein QBC41DRAFT_266937 [Cercophora samala]